MTPDTELLAVTPAEVARLDADLAAAIYPHGAVLRCQACGRQRKASRRECGELMASWPACCGVVMGAEPRKLPME